MKQIVVLAVVALLLTACRSACCPGGIAVSEQNAVAEVDVPVQREATQSLPGFDRITVGGETIDLPRVRHAIRVNGAEQGAFARLLTPPGDVTSEPLPGFDRITVGGETIDLPRVRHAIRVER